LLDFRKACNENKHELMQKPNVVGVGVGYKHVNGKQTTEDALLVFVKQKLPATRLRKSELIPRQLQGHQTDVIEVGEIRLLSRTGYFRPAPPGCSIGHYRITAGTLGAVVRDKKNKEPLILSNNHVLANSSDGRDGKAEHGDAILQPGPADGGLLPKDTIAELERFIPLEKEIISPVCRYGSFFQRTLNSLLKIIFPSYRMALYKINRNNNLVDAALARPLTNKYIKYEILELGKPTGTAEVMPGSTVTFSGRTSGVRSGKVLAVASVIRVNLDQETTALFEDQIITEGISAPGDSGSLVVNGKMEAIGLLFAGSEQITACNRIHNVMRLLNIEL
jgi:hypothetical protein